MRRSFHSLSAVETRIIVAKKGGGGGYVCRVSSTRLGLGVGVFAIGRMLD